MIETDISNLSTWSSKRVIKICDRCNKKLETKLCDVNRSRKRRNTTKDYCYKCSMAVYNRGDGNPSKKEKVEKKISENTKGKSKRFKYGNNPRIIGRKISSSGYVLVYNNTTNEYVNEHRYLIEKDLGRKLKKEEIVHHINADKKDNRLENLCVMSVSEHSSLHTKTDDLIKGLVNTGIILFDKDNKKYHLSPSATIDTMPISLGFENIAIKQKKNICKSRLDVSIKSESIRGVHLDNPLIASNMNTVCDSQFCIDLNNSGCLGVMHRVGDDDFLCAEVKKIAKKCEWVAASIGTGDDQYEFANMLIKSGANIIFVDVAHGYSDSVIDIGKKIKLNFPSTKIVIGNATNENIIYDIYEFADAVKVGIAQGFACETKNTAGCTEKQFSAVLKFKYLSKQFGIPVISDGGIREPADLVKSIGAGANSIMAGKIFAACPESAAEVLEIDGRNKKVYAGMASRYVQNRWRGGLKDGTCPEGGVRYLDIGESLENLVERYSGALRSGITYAGGNDIESFQNSVEFVRIS